MAALHLHHAMFTNEKDADLPFHSATPFLHPAPENDRHPLASSAAYQDLIQRQPTHPDGPTSGWDLGLDLVGDPLTPAEHKRVQDRRTKRTLRRWHATILAFELVLGVWTTYTTVRYALAFADGVGDAKDVCALVLGIVSALALALVTVAISMPLFPRQSHLRAWRCTRSLLRACYLLLLSTSAILNVVLVSLWHPTQPCHWDIDIAWYTSTTNTNTSPCRTAPFAAWMAAAVLRLVVTLAMAVSFIYTLRSYDATRYPTSVGNRRPKYSPYSPSDPEETSSPLSTSSPLQFSKSTFRFMRSADSGHTLNRSNVTLPKYNSISTLAASTSCTGHSRSHSTPPAPRDTSLPRISPPTSRRTSLHGSSSFTPPVGFETPSVMNDATAHAWGPHMMLRRTSRISVMPVAPDTTMPSDIASHSPTIARDPPEIRSGASWKAGHRGSSGVHIDVGKTTRLAWENDGQVRHGSHVARVGPESASMHDGGESIEEKVRDDDDDNLMYSYGYGASGSTYPYLDMYNPQRPDEYTETVSLCEDMDHHRRAVPGGEGLDDVSSEPRSLTCREEEEEEYVAMMGGFVRRMATIESLGSREAGGTLSTTTGSVARHSMRSGGPASQFSSVRFADIGSSCTSSAGVCLSTREGSLNTAYLSFSSGGTGVQVNERGERFPGGSEV